MGAYRGDCSVEQWLTLRHQPVKTFDQAICVAKLTKHAIEILMERPAWADTSELKDSLKDYAVANHINYNSTFIAQAMDAAQRGIEDEKLAPSPDPHLVRSLRASHYRRR